MAPYESAVARHFSAAASVLSTLSTTTASTGTGAAISKRRSRPAPPRGRVKVTVNASPTRFPAAKSVKNLARITGKHAVDLCHTAFELHKLRSSVANNTYLIGTTVQHIGAVASTLSGGLVTQAKDIASLKSGLTTIEERLNKITNTVTALDQTLRELEPAFFTLRCSFHDTARSHLGVLNRLRKLEAGKSPFEDHKPTAAPPNSPVYKPISPEYESTGSSTGSSPPRKRARTVTPDIKEEDVDIIN